MARARIEVDNDVAASNASQDPKFAKPVGAAKSGFAVFIFEVGAASGTTVSIETSPQPNVGSSGTSAFWYTAGSGSPSTTGQSLVVVALSNLMDLIRWKVAGSTGVRFSVVVYLYDT